MPFFALFSFRLRGDAFIGDTLRLDASTSEGSKRGFIGEGASKLVFFFLFGVPDRVGGKTSLIGMEPSGRMT